MISTATQIGFDRFIHLDWVAAALKVRAGTSSLNELDEMLDAVGLGKAAKDKTRTKLNAIALEPKPGLADFINRGVHIFSGIEDKSEIAAFAWGAAIATYPYFGQVAEFIGRLTAIQGDCAVSEIHRRMSEVYGDREITKRATQAVIQTQAAWGGIARVKTGNRLVRLPKITLRDENAVSWMIESVLRYHQKAVSLSSIQSSSVIYPFAFDLSVGYALSKSQVLAVRLEGPGHQLIDLRSTK